MNAERYERQERVFSSVGISGLVIIAARGIVAVATSESEAASTLAVALGFALLACVVVLGFAVRARRRMLRGLASGGAVAAPGVVASTSSVPWGRRAAAALACIAAIGALAYVAAPPSLKKLRWTFTEPSAAPTELGLRSASALANGSGSGSGEWRVEDDAHATGARALVNREGSAAATPALIVAASAFTRDLRAVTRCKVAPDMPARACGVVFRFRDESNYHVARLDSADGTLVVSALSGGRERVLGTREAKVASGVWQELAVEARGARIRLSLNGTSALDVVDSAPASAGNVGLWSPAAGVAYFDELSVDPLPASAQAFELLPLLGKGRS